MSLSGEYKTFNQAIFVTYTIKTRPHCSMIESTKSVFVYL